MILLFLFISFELDIKIDSLKASLTQNPQLSTVLELNKCYFCPNTETKYCGMCKKWMCDVCRANYPERMKAFIRNVIRL